MDPAYLREAVVAVDRGEPVVAAARRFGIRPALLTAALRHDSQARVQLREIAIYAHIDDALGSVIGGY